MAIKKNEKTGLYDVSYHKRHPLTRVPIRAARIGIKSEAQAKRMLHELIIQVERTLHAVQSPKWNQVIEEYVEDCRFRGLSEKTITSIQVCTMAHTSEVWGNRLIDTITRDEVLTIHKQTVGGKSQGHQKYMLKCFRLIFKFALEKGYVNKSPVPLMKFKDGSKIMPVLNESQIRKLLQLSRQLSSQWYYHWALALYTGMRNGELYALDWKNVDLSGGVIYVKEAWDSKNGFKPFTKSHWDRVVSIVPELMIVLKELKLQSKGSSFVLPRLVEWDRGNQAIELRKFLVGAGLPEVRFHDLRASWATLLLSKGVEAIKLMSMGGWRDYKTMMVYIRKAGIDIRGGTDVLNLHDPLEKGGQLLNFFSGSQS
jgi:integrase